MTKITVSHDEVFKALRAQIDLIYEDLAKLLISRDIDLENLAKYKYLYEKFTEYTDYLYKGVGGNL